MNIEMFERLPQDKQDKIFQAALSEFAAYGFDAASTNRIVKQAGIPKGSLFQYFGDKESLFLYLCRKIELEIEEQQETTRKSLPSDFFEAIVYLFERDIEYMKSRAKYLQFMVIMASQPQHPVYQKVVKQDEEDEWSKMREFISNIPRDQLREDVDFEDLMQLLLLLIQSVSQQVEKLIITNEGNLEQVDAELKEIIRDFQKFLNMLRFGIYKP